MDFSQTISLNQKMVLTKRMQQSLAVLQMPIHILQENINNELNENPLLETETEFESELEPGAESQHDPVVSGKELLYEKDSYEKLIGDSCSSYQDDFIFEQKENPMDYVSRNTSLKEFLQEQSGFLKEPPQIIRIIHYIIECIDHNGYLVYSVEDIAAVLKVGMEKVEYALDRVQEFEPCGIGARNLKECLTIQLKQKNITNPYIKEIIQNHLQLIAENKIKEIAKALGISITEAAGYCDYIKNLEPKPTRGFVNDQENRYIIPEASIKVIDNTIYLIMNEGILPKLKINGYYREIFSKDADAETKKYIKEKLDQALFTINSISQRKKTLHRLLEEIIVLQNDYFIKGEQFLKPMSINQLADKLSVHPSTVSRAVNEKYIETPYRIIGIRALFTTGFGDNQDTISSKNIKNEIAKMIKGENKQKPLSDQQICELLLESKITLSRRTVAKYREELEIPSSVLRKKY